MDVELVYATFLVRLKAVVSGAVVDGKWPNATDRNPGQGPDLVHVSRWAINPAEYLLGDFPEVTAPGRVVWQGGAEAPRDTPLSRDVPRPVLPVR
jgi:hypothetical protein